MIYGSVSSGIEAATVAWHELGWVPAWFAEIATFPNDVLAHHYPHVPNLGDMTKIRNRIATGEIAAPDVLVGGTPCQAFSVAGLRNSLDDDRGQLTLEFVRIANEIDSARLVRGEQPCIAVWENVPGVLNTKDNAFGCFLGALAGSGCELQPPGGRWGNAGYIAGLQRQVAWRVLDAQYFGLAQRRKRVFVIASAMAGFDPAEILLERQSVHGNPTQGRLTQQNIAGTLEASAGRSRGAGTSPAILTVQQQTYRMLGFGHYKKDEHASTIKSRDYKDATDLVVRLSNGSQKAGALDTQCGFQKATMQSVNAGHLVVHGTQDPLVNQNIAHPLGRNGGQENVVCYPINTMTVMGRPSDQGRMGSGIGQHNDPCPTITKRHSHAVCYTIKGNIIGRQDNFGGNGLGIGADIYYTLTKTDVHAVFQQNTRDEVRFIQGKGQVAGALAAQAGMKQQNYLFNKMSQKVRRFMPIECERLQGFPDNYTLIPTTKKTSLKPDELAFLQQLFPDATADELKQLCADAPRYAALGNSMAVPVMRWIGQRIQNYLFGLKAA